MNKHLINNITFGVILAGLTALVCLMFYRYVGMVVITGIYCVLMYPVYKWVLLKVRNHKWVALTIVIVGSVLFILIPATLVLLNVINELTEYVSSLNIVVAPTTLDSGINSVNQILVKANLGTYRIDQAEINNALRSLISSTWQNVLNGVNSFVTVALSSIYFVVMFFIFVVFMLPNWEKVTALTRKLIPLEDDIKNIFIRRSKVMTVDVIKGTALTGLIQGLLSWVFFTIIGVPNAFLLSFCIMFLAFIPVFGAALVTIPLSLYYAFTGQYVMAIAIILWHLLVISSIDNIVRPIAVSSEAKVNAVIMFFAFIAGVQVFGPMGIFYGPIVVVLFMTALEIFQEKYLEQTMGFFKSQSRDPTKFEKKVKGYLGMMKRKGSKEK